jgi:hypothetical protein
MTKMLIEELSMFSITEAGRFEGVGTHDDLVMSLALANSASSMMGENFVLLDDMDIFSSPVERQPNPGVMWLNF